MRKRMISNPSSARVAQIDRVEPAGSRFRLRQVRLRLLCAARGGSPPTSDLSEFRILDTRREPPAVEDHDPPE